MKSIKILVILLYFFLGFFSTSPALSIPSLNYTSVFTILWVICLIQSFLMIDKRVPKLQFPKSYHYYIVWLSISILSSLFGFVFFLTESTLWSYTSLEGLVKIIQYLLLIIFLKKNRYRGLIVKCILYGLLVGMISNISWSILDAVIYYGTGISINNEIFSGYAKAIGARYDVLSLTYGSIIRSSGFNMDPANVGFFIVVVFSYALRSKKNILILLSIFGVFATGSFTAIAGIIVSSLIYYYSNFRKFLYALTIILFVLCASMFISKNNIVFSSMEALMKVRIEQKKGAVEDKDNQRTIYIKYFIPAVIHMPTSLFIGTGFYTSSYPYLKYGYCKNEEYRPYDPEQTYIATFFDCGLFGFMAFLFMTCGLFRRFYKNNYANITDCSILQYASVESMLITYLSYHYVLYSVIMLFLITGSLKDEND